MATFQESLVDNVRQGLCNTLSLAERTAQLGEQFYDTVGLRPAGSLSGQAAQLWSNAAGLACNRVPQDMSPEVTVPFTGGQCVGDVYEVDTQRGGGPITTQTTTDDGDLILGPITGIREQVNDFGLFDYILFVGNGQKTLATNFTTPQNFRVVDVRNVTNPADPCGDPQAQGPEYDPADFTISPTINFDDEGGNPQSVGVDITYSPVNNNETGDFVVPFSVNFNDGSSVFGDFNFSTGDINIGGGNSGGGGVQNDPVELDEDQEDVPNGLLLVGCRVVATVDPDVSTATEIFTSNNSPNLFVPRLGTIRFSYETPNGQEVLGPDLSVKQLSEIFWSGPVAVDVVSQENIGVTFSLRRVVVKESAVGLLGGGGST